MQPLNEAFRAIRRAARDRSRVSGLTHLHYKYPARFSPEFVRAVLAAFSKPGDLVLDPYMGGGTTIVEALAMGRRAIGSDVNTLAVFVAKAKTTTLSKAEAQILLTWAQETLQRLTYRGELAEPSGRSDQARTKNLGLPRARAIKKYLALALETCRQLETDNLQTFARAILLNVSQWALNGKKASVTLSQFRERIAYQTHAMVDAAFEFGVSAADMQTPILLHSSAEHLLSREPFSTGSKVDLVVTSPPYPGVHILYHRWQVDGRRETPAPYWIANCLDGQGSAYYNFGDRKQSSQDKYFEASLRTLREIRKVMLPDAVFVQMLAFADPREQLPRYLQNMAIAGFTELRTGPSGQGRIWRQVPSRTWHAELQGNTTSAREVVLVHRAS